MHSLIELALNADENADDSKEETVQEDSKDNETDIETARVISAQVESIMQITGLPEERRELARNMLLLMDRDISRVVTVLTQN